MMRILWAAALIVAAMACEQRPAQAYDAPWCASHNNAFGATEECRFNTLEECVQDVVAGNRGFCNENPRYHGPEPRHDAPRHRSPRH